MAQNVLSLTMVGKAYYLCGKSYYRCRGPETLTKDLKSDEVSQFVAFGEKSSWYRSFTQKEAKKGSKPKETQVISRSPNFAEQYPALDKPINEYKLFDAPKCLSLGQNGRFFAHIGQKKMWKLPKSMEDPLGNLADYSAVWLGNGECYVAVRKDGGCSISLNGKYAGLKEEIKSHGAPKVLAMNLEDDQEYVAVWPNGRYSRKSGRTCLPSEDANIFFEKLGFKTKQ